MPVNNVRVKSIPINLDKERNLRFDLNALAELEEIYGDFQEAFKSLQKGSIKAMRAMLYSGLKHEDEALTLKDVGAMVDIVSMKDISGKIAEALKEAFPNPGEEKKK